VPELPDIAVYLDALDARIGGCTLKDVRIASPFVVRTVQPPVASLIGRAVIDSTLDQWD
jgi:formamidopyrimidine-DNA glycosylase